METLKKYVNNNFFGRKAEKPKTQPQQPESQQAGQYGSFNQNEKPTQSTQMGGIVHVYTDLPRKVY